MLKHLVEMKSENPGLKVSILAWGMVFIDIGI